MKRVTFVRSHRMYNAGETAGFLPQQADDLIKSGFAVDADQAEKQAKAMARAEAKAIAKAAADQAAFVDPKISDDTDAAADQKPATDAAAESSGGQE